MIRDRAAGIIAAIIIAVVAIWGAVQGLIAAAENAGWM